MTEQIATGVVVLSMATISTIGIGMVLHHAGHSIGWALICWPFLVLLMNGAFGVEPDDEASSLEGKNTG